MDVAFLLCPVTQNPQPSWVRLEKPNEIVAHSVCLSWADNVGEAKCPAKKTEHMAVGGNQSFASEFARAVS